MTNKYTLNTHKDMQNKKDHKESNYDHKDIHNNENDAKWPKRGKKTKTKHDIYLTLLRGPFFHNLPMNMNLYPTISSEI